MYYLHRSTNETHIYIDLDLDLDNACIYIHTYTVHRSEIATKVKLTNYIWI